MKLHARRIAAGLLFPAALLAGLAMAGAAMADVSGLYGNVILARFPGGQQVKVRLHRDGTFEETLPDGSKATGTFTEDARGVCFTELAPPPPAGTAPECVAVLSGAKLGDAWDMTEPHPYKLSIVAGD
jgi:hypothetical protein